VAACLFVALLVLPGAIAHARPGPPRAAVTRAGPPRGVVSRPEPPRAAVTRAGPARGVVSRPEPPRAAVTRAGPPRGVVSRPGPPLRADWRWPLHGPVVGHFRVTPRAPFARGQRRGIDLAAAPGSAVRAACAGRVTFRGALPRLGLAISVRCGALVATYLRLGTVVVRRGAVVAPGQPLGTLGPAGALRLGARRAADRRGYLDPLTLLGDPTPPSLGPAPLPRRSRRPRGPRPGRPRPARPRPLPPPPPRPLPRRTASPAAAERLPWPAYPALALVATALPVGGLVRRRRRTDALGSEARAPL
jgi:Peptidase family M23